MAAPQNNRKQPPKGRPFQKGVSGNPGGRPCAPKEVQELAMEKSVAAIQRLAVWMDSDNPRASVAACQVILDRALGKPTQPISGDPLRPPIGVNVTTEEVAALSKEDREAIRTILGRAASLA